MCAYIYIEREREFRVYGLKPRGVSNYHENGESGGKEQGNELDTGVYRGARNEGTTKP